MTKKKISSELESQLRAQALRDLQTAWRNLTLGVPAHVVARAMNAAKPGNNFRECTKQHLREVYCGLTYHVVDEVTRKAFARALTREREAFEKRQRDKHNAASFAARAMKDAVTLCESLREWGVHADAVQQFNHVYIMLPLEEARDVLKRISGGTPPALLTSSAPDSRACSACEDGTVSYEDIDGTPRWMTCEACGGHGRATALADV